MKQLSLKIQVVGLLAGFAAILLTGGVAAAQGQYTKGSTGVDVSYPNCSAKLTKVSFGIVGVTGGLGFSPNPCLTAEAGHFANLSLYANTGWPGTSSTHNDPNNPRQCVAEDLNCLAYNYGYNAGQYAVNYANTAGVHSATWWLDVETLNSWAADSQQNRNSLQGQYDALTASGINTVGVYSTSAQWNTVTDSWLNGWPSWGATSWRTASQAATYCSGHQFTGGPSYLMQYLGKLDQDVAC